MSVIKHADYIGGIDEEKLKEIADAAISIGDYDSKCREIQPQDLRLGHRFRTRTTRKMGNASIRT